MTSAIGLSVGARPTSGATRWPALIETLLALAAIALLIPSFDRVAADDSGREQRFANVALAVGGLPERVLAPLCASHGRLAEPLVRDRLCRAVGSSPAHADAMPSLIADAYAQIARAFGRPLADAEARRTELRLQQREGLGDLLELDSAIEAIDAALQPYVERYGLTGRDGVPQPLACAFEAVKSATMMPSERGDVATGNALLLLGAALDGHAATPSLAAAALLPPNRRTDASCARMSLADALSASAQLLAEARQARALVAKNAAMRELLHTAGWQWAAWMAVGLVLVKLARRRRFAAPGVALALTLWAIAAWIGRVPWPFGIERVFETGRDTNGWFALPPPFVLAMLAAAGLMLVLSPWLAPRLPSAPQAPASRIGYPGLVIATGIGWLLLLDLSANGNFANRYLALYHHGHLWLGMVALTVVAFMRQSIGRALAWSLAMLGALSSLIRRGIGGVALVPAALLTMIALIGAVGALLSNVPQISSELAKLWLIVGASWFFFLRGDPLVQRLAHSGGSLGSLVRYLAPLLFVVGVLLGVQLVTHDMGPLLIATYGAGAFMAAALAMWWHQRSGAYAAAFVVAIGSFVAWIAGITLALFELGPMHEVTAGRLENLAAPLASANDQLAIVTWFQHAAPPAGFGIGSVPWCGYASALGCPGVPAQIQSDYTLTALVGAFGWTIAWTVTIGGAIWLHRLIRHHGRATRGEPRLVSASGRLVNDDQALISWLGVTWVALALCQLAVTVAGNLAVLPLTGVTFPFVSFGMTSLVVNMAMLGMCINVNRVQPRPSAAGCS